jgi:hypothetical protein
MHITQTRNGKCRERDVAVTQHDVLPRTGAIDARSQSLVTPIRHGSSNKDGQHECHHVVAA